MRFEFSTATRIIFGPGTTSEVGQLASEMGRTACVVTGRTPERAAPLLSQLNQQGIDSVTFKAPPEPTTRVVIDGIERARQAGCDLVIGLGGGSVLDTGKAIAALLTNKGELIDYLEVVGHGHGLSEAPAPYIAIPTTSGSGAEVTRNAVLSSPEHRVKASVRSPLMLPRVALVDPELTYSMPPELTASTGLDALAQLMEPYLSKQANPLTDAICQEGLRRVARSLRRCYENGSDAAAREDMSMASLFSGLALANAKLGAIHGLAAPLGGLLSAPHGAICARLLPAVMEVNVRASNSRGADSPALSRYDTVARILTQKTTAQAADGVAWAQELCTCLKVPSLSEFGLQENDFPNIVREAQRASSTKGNPIELTDEELTEVLSQTL